jgi:hypothetical protein
MMSVDKVRTRTVEQSMLVEEHVDPADNAEELRQAYADAASAFNALEREMDCWTNPRKRAAVLAARLAYQDAKLYFVCVSRGTIR